MASKVDQWAGFQGYQSDSSFLVVYYRTESINSLTYLHFSGRDLSRAEQYGLVLLISLPLFILASAGSTVFWIIGVYTMQKNAFAKTRIC